MMLEERMGKDAYARRLVIERYRLEEYYRPVSPRMVAFKVRVLRPILRFALRVLGLYRSGRRQYHDLSIRRNTLEIPGLPSAFAGYRIMQMSDLHIDLDPSLVDTIAVAVGGLKCDICVMTGDYRNATVGPSDEVIPLMRRLREALDAPTYAVLGNHDLAEMVAPLEEAGIVFLVNEAKILQRGAEAIALVGIDDPNVYGTHDLAHALHEVPRGMVKILLSHSPVIYREAAEHGIAAVLAGHTHGGQICLPGGIILSRNDKSPRRFHRGGWHYHDVQGYTSVGTGACGLPVRFNCQPEVTIHTLQPAVQDGRRELEECVSA